MYNKLDPLVMLIQQVKMDILLCWRGCKGAKEVSKRKVGAFGTSGNDTSKQNVGNANKVRKNIEDRLSNLPDKILQHILSFLDTKCAVQASVLSKRWRFLWQGLSNLRFRDFSFHEDDSFKKFVTHVLIHRDDLKILREFTIVCRRRNYLFTYSKFLHKIVYYLLSHGNFIQDLCFWAYVDLNFLPPFLPHLFTWESLRTLTLVRLVIQNLSFDFVSLDTLRIFNCRLCWNKGDNFDPFRGCLKLKKLKIYGGKISQCVKCFKISAPELKDLRITRMEFGDLDPHYKILLSSLKLQSFSFKGPKLIEFSIECLPFLEKVNVHIGEKCPTVHYSSTEKDHKYLINMLQGVGNAKSLTLSHETIDVLSKIPDLLRSHSSPFTGVHDVKIIVRRDSSSNMPSFIMPLRAITYLLSGSPSAKGITVEHSKVKQKF